jgi:hypothetical protein
MPVPEPFEDDRCAAEFPITGQRCRRRVHGPEPTHTEGKKATVRFIHVTDPAEHMPGTEDQMTTTWEEYPEDA